MNLREDDYKFGLLYQASTSVPALQEGALAARTLVLPPLAEQHRIVAKVDALITFLERLEASLATRRRLLEPLLHKALAPAVKSEMVAAECAANDRERIAV